MDRTTRRTRVIDRAGSARSVAFEELEARRLLVFDPTSQEQYMMELLNRMRLNPAAELGLMTSSLGVQARSANAQIDNALVQFRTNGQVLAQQWAQLTAVPPLAWNEALYLAAQGHNAAMIAADMQTHQAPGEPALGTRATNAGYTNWTGLGENVYAFSYNVFYGHAGFAIDWGGDPMDPNYTGIQNPPGHRITMMSSNYREVGIRIANPGNVPGKEVGPQVITQDFGRRWDQGNAFLLGVVFGDTTGNGYSEGEGFGNVSITAVAGNGSAGAPMYSASSMSAGGWQMQVPAGTYAVTFSGSGFGAAVTYYNIEVSSQNVKLDAIKGVVPPAPVIRVYGNDYLIVSGDTTPNRDDWTNLGNANRDNQTVTRQFKIYNAGNQTLSFPGGQPRVRIGGANAGDFMLTVDAPATIPAQGQPYFTIVFDPSGLGVRTATVTILSNDPATPSYTFSIQGHGIQRPIAQVSGNQQTIAAGDTTPTTADWTNFGGVNTQTTTKVRVFTVRNVGLATMNLGTVTLTGVNAGRFVVFVQPAPTVAPGGSTQFRVRFMPGGAVGFAYATVRVASSDPLTPNHVFDIRGNGLAMARMEVFANNTIILPGDTTPSTVDFTDYASVGVDGGVKVRLFTIRNTGLADLVLSGGGGPSFVSLVGGNVGDWVVSGQPATGVIAPGASVTFKVRFDPTTTGQRSTSVVLNTNDTGLPGGQFVFAVSGVGV